MTARLKREKCIFAFCDKNTAAMTVQSGQSIDIETYDCFSNQLQKPGDTLDKIDWEKVNPATGPLFVEEAEVGDVLKVVIEEIKVDRQGVMAAGADLGPLGDRLAGLDSKLIPIRDNNAVFDDTLEIPVKPMIGVIGVSPRDSRINTGTPGSHGGNMDNAMVGEGAVLYFPVFVKGALLALGDVHAVMGDGEVCGTGIEIAASVRINVEVIKGICINNPVLETNEAFTTIASAEILDDAVKQSVNDMADILSKKMPMQLREIAMLMSAVGHVQVCQVVDPLKTARFLMPKWVLGKYGFKFI